MERRRPSQAYNQVSSRLIESDTLAALLIIVVVITIFSCCCPCKNIYDTIDWNKPVNTSVDYDHFRSRTMSYDKHYSEGKLVYTSKKHLRGKEMYRDTFVNDSFLFKKICHK